MLYFFITYVFKILFMNFHLSKIRILIFVLFISASSQAIAQKATDEVLNEAFSEAQLKNKKVLVIFHASWCSWCKKMEKQLKDPQISEFIDDTFVITYLTVMEAKDKKDLENPGAAEFLEQHGGARSGIPFWLIFDKNRKLLTNSLTEKGNNLGCPYSPEEVTEFSEKLKEYTDLSPQQIKSIAEVFIEK